MRKLALLLVALSMHADEGMWTFNKFPAEKLRARYGFSPAQQWLDHVRLSSVRLAEGCSASLVSPTGLVLTNYHCAVTCIQELSTGDKDLSAKGFQARSPAEELRCPGQEANILEGIDDVTAKIAAATKGLPDKAANDARKAGIARIEKECATSNAWRCEVISLYGGGVYDLYKYHRYQDVRIVFAPEFQAAFFGGDPDNFTYPRHDIDMALFRVYDNGKPIDTRDYLKWNPQGAKDEELVFVAGHPGSTSRLDTLAQLEVERDLTIPSVLKMLKHRIEVLRKYSALGPEQAREAGSDIFGLENSVKAYEGSLKGLRDKNVWDTKRKQEEEFRAMVTANPQW